jgi:hypothetical protein
MMNRKLIKVINHIGMGEYCYSTQRCKDILEFVYSDGFSRVSPKPEQSTANRHSDEYEWWATQQQSIGVF